MEKVDYYIKKAKTKKTDEKRRKHNLAPALT